MSKENKSQQMRQSKILYIYGDMKTSSKSYYSVSTVSAFLATRKSVAGRKGCKNCYV